VSKEFQVLGGARGRMNYWEKQLGRRP